jgi:hypothetical protein
MKMSKTKSFTGWAVNRAEEIVSRNGLELLHSTEPDARWTRDECIVRLTVAILEALIEAHNFDASSAGPLLN